MSIQGKPYARGASLSSHTLAYVPGDKKIRPLRDQIILEPINAKYSDTLILVDEDKPVKGRILAIGPGHYPLKYDHPEKHRRTKMWPSKQFRPTELKVGDIVELGKGYIDEQAQAYPFETFRWGDRLCLHCREADVAAVHPRSLDQGAAA